MCKIFFLLPLYYAFALNFYPLLFFIFLANLVLKGSSKLKLEGKFLNFFYLKLLFFFQIFELKFYFQIAS